MRVLLLCARSSSLLGLALLAAALPAEQRPLQVGTAKQLFIDERFIESSRGVRLVVNRPQPTGEKLLVVDKPWEDYWIADYATVLQEGDRIHLWYESNDRKENNIGVAYAYSTDGGASWTKPELGIIEFAGSTRNNLVLRGTQGAIHVFRNRPDAPGAERYAMYVGGANRAFVSPDGLHWSLFGATPFLDKAANQHMTLDSQNVVFWDTRLRKYVLYARFNVPADRGTARVVRTFRRAESPTLGGFTGFETVFAPDERDPIDFDWYTTAAIEYPWAADAYFMWPAAYYHTPPPPKNDGPLDIRFAASRDGVHWLRPDRGAVIRMGYDGEWDHGSMYAAYGLTREGSDLYLYYTAHDVTHGAYVARGFLGGIISRAKYRLDGFMSLDAGYEGGDFTTPPLERGGDRLELNFDGSAGGEAKVEVLDAGGKPVPGFSGADAARVRGNGVAKPVAWRAAPDLSALPSGPIKLRIALRDAKLYAFQFR
jgi:hypothetical protein